MVHQSTGLGSQWFTAKRDCFREISSQPAWVHSGSRPKGSASQRFPVNEHGFTVVHRQRDCFTEISSQRARVHSGSQSNFKDVRIQSSYPSAARGARYARAPQLGRNENVLPGAHAAAYGRGNTCAHLLLVTVVAGAVEVTVPASGGMSYRSVPCHDGVPGRRTADTAELYQKAFTHDTAIAYACVIAYASACTCAYACARVY